MHHSKHGDKISSLGVVIWLIAAIFFLYEFFLRTFVGTVASQIMEELNLSPASFSLLGTAYFLAYGMMQVPVGIFCDKFGVKKIMLFATIVCVLATFLFSHATNFKTAFFSRFLMGFGSSFAFVCLLVIALNWLPKKYFAFFSGASQFIGTLGPLLAAGPLISMISALHETWRTALAQIGYFGLALTILIFFFVKNKPRKSTNTVTYLQKGTPLLKQLKKLIINRQAWLIALYSALVYIALSLLAAVWGTNYLEAKGLSQTVAAYCVSISWIGYAVGCPLLGALSDMIKRRKPLLIIPAIIGFFSIMTILFWKTPNATIFAISFLLLGIAASGQNIGFAFIVEQVDENVKSTALGMNNGMITLFSAIMPAITGWIITKAANGHPSHLVLSDFYWAFIILPVFYLIAFVISTFFLRETFCKTKKEIEVLIR